MSAYSAVSFSPAVTLPPSASLPIEYFLRKVHSGLALPRGEAREVVSLLLAPQTTDAQAGAMLAALSQRGETIEEVIGFAQAMRDRMIRVACGITAVVDTAGTGGAPARGFNVSTAAALVAAGAGVVVAKHGGRAGTSTSGSADVLQALGVRIDCEPTLAVRCLQQAGMAFLFAPKYHPAMARVAPIRRQMAIRTTFNLAGPLSNPTGAEHQLIGVADGHLLEIVAGALAELGTKHAWVVHGREGLDEISICGETNVVEVRGRELTRFSVSPTSFGMSARPLRTPRLSPAENARILRELLAGDADTALQELVLLNAAAAVLVGGRCSDLLSAVDACRESLRSGAALRTLNNMVRLSAGDEVKE